MAAASAQRTRPGPWPLLACLALALAWGCAGPPAPVAPGPYYLTPPLTYLRDAAGYESNVVAQLYRGEAVERLDASNEGGWWRVRAGRTGQNGWVPAELLSPQPVPVRHLYVAVTTVPLRECPEGDCPSLQLLYGGDRVQELEANPQGWVRVLAEKGRTLGWVPKGALAEQPAAAPSRRPQNPYVYVAVPRLKLRLNPSPQAPVVKTLALNDQLERLEETPAGWVRVRQPAGAAVGWVQGRHLEPAPVKAPPRKKKPGAPEKKEEAPEPEIM